MMYYNCFSLAINKNFKSSKEKKVKGELFMNILEIDIMKRRKIFLCVSMIYVGGNLYILKGIYIYIYSEHSN